MSHELIAKTLQDSLLFKHLTEEQKSYLAANAELLTAIEGDIVIQEGAHVSSLFIILSGQVRVSTHALDREVELKHLGAGAYFGEVSLLSGKEATATVEAVAGGATLIALERAAVIDIIQQDEKVRRMLEGVTLARAKDTIAKVLQ